MNLPPAGDPSIRAVFHGYDPVTRKTLQEILQFMFTIADQTIDGPMRANYRIPGTGFELLSGQRRGLKNGWFPIACSGIRTQE